MLHREFPASNVRGVCGSLPAHLRMNKHACHRESVKHLQMRKYVRSIQPGHSGNTMNKKAPSSTLQSQQAWTHARVLAISMEACSECLKLDTGTHPWHAGCSHMHGWMAHLKPILAPSQVDQGTLVPPPASALAMPYDMDSMASCITNGMRRVKECGLAARVACQPGLMPYGPGWLYCTRQQLAHIC